MTPMNILKKSYLFEAEVSVRRWVGCQPRSVLFAALLVSNSLCRAAEVGAQQPPLRLISSVPACSQCEIALDPKVTLRVPGDSLSFGIESEFTRLSNGSFVVRGLSETVVPALLDSSGQFVRMIARRGIGPGEIESADLVVVTPGDSVWVLGSGRKHIFSRDMLFVRREERWRPADDLQFQVNGTVILATPIPTKERAGYPLHLAARSGEILRSFGTTDPTIDVRRLTATGDGPSGYLSRKLSAGASGSFWSYNPSRFLLEHYDASGQLLEHVRHELDSWYADATSRRPSPGDFKGLSLSYVIPSREPNLLWLVYFDRNASFRTPDSESMKGSHPWVGMHDTVVEAVDTRTFRVLATRRFPALTAERIRNSWDMVAIYRAIDDNFSEYHVSTLRLVRQTQPEGQW
jgi:hypothetical protein